MRPRFTLLVIVALAAPSAADTFRGFSGVDRPYLVDQDQVCTPLVVAAGAAVGVPACAKRAADLIARLSFKDPVPQRGSSASFTATASGRTLTVARGSGEKLVAWDAPDAVGKVLEVFASQYQDRVAVAYRVRRLGRDVTEIVAFDLQPAAAAIPTGPDPTSAPVAAVRAAADPAVTRAVAAARKARPARALAAWKAVLAVDDQHVEALYRIAALQVTANQRAAALATVTALATSTRPDAIEWLVEARFDPAFAPVRGDPAFRAHTGIDRKGTSSYERLMGFGGQWEQTGTSCDKPEVRFVATRERAVKIRVISHCEGRVYDLPFKGTWRIDGARVVLTFPTRGKQVTAADEAACQFESAGDEDSLRCSLGRDLDFVVLPARR